jgi:hypothetical protein
VRDVEILQLRQEAQILERLGGTLIDVLEKIDVKQYSSSLAIRLIRSQPLLAGADPRSAFGCSLAALDEIYGRLGGGLLLAPAQPAINATAPSLTTTAACCHPHFCDR